jgi:DNA-3-methyladenine glycosylase II
LSFAPFGDASYAGGRGWKKARLLFYALSGPDMRQHYLILKPIAPFQLDLTAWVLRRRSHNIIDQWDNGVYRRILTVDHRRIGIAVRQTGSAGKPTLRVKLSGQALTASQKALVKHSIERLLGTNIGLDEFYRFSAQDKTLGPVVKKYLGFKPPRYLSIFEAAVNGICSQQLSLAVAVVLLNRLATACSRPVDNDGQLMYSFPEPAAVARLKMSQLKKMGFSTNKAKALLELAANVAARGADLESLRMMNDEDAIKELVKLRGIGQWTAEYVLLRGLGRLHMYPSGDVGLQNGLKRWFKLRGKMDSSAVRDIMAKWKLYGGMIYFHLLLEKLSREGYIK